MAAAEKGLAKKTDGLGAAGDPGWMEEGVLRSEKRVGERRGELKERRYSAMKKASFMAQMVKRTFCTGKVSQSCSLFSKPLPSQEELESVGTYLIRIILLQQPTPRRVHILMTLILSAHNLRRKHMHIMAGQIQRNQRLKHNTPSREGLRQKHQ